MDNFRHLILVRGLPGSGKTTLARMFSGMGYVHAEADQFFETVDETFNRTYSFNPGLLPQAHAFCLARADEGLRLTGFVVVSNTFSRLWEMQPYVDLAKKHGAKLTVVETQGNYGSIHGVPQTTIDKMKERWEKYE